MYITPVPDEDEVETRMAVWMDDEHYIYVWSDTAALRPGLPLGLHLNQASYPIHLLHSTLSLSLVYFIYPTSSAYPPHQRTYVYTLYRYPLTHVLEQPYPYPY